MINIAVEGESDRETARAVVAAAGHEVGEVFPARGKTKLDPKIQGYIRAAMFGGPGWVVFRDSDGQCPVELRTELLGSADDQSSRFELRIACSMTEAWLLADREGFARFFRVRAGKIPEEPDTLVHAKQTLLTLVKNHGSGAVRDDVVRKDGQTGPLYVGRLNEFAREHWDVTVAAGNSPSLARAVARIGSLPRG